jgi:hypothetical protein
MPENLRLIGKQYNSIYLLGNRILLELVMEAQETLERGLIKGDVSTIFLFL